MAHDLPDDLNADFWLFHIAFWALTNLHDAELARHSRIHNWILFVIAQAGDIAVGDIADRLEISQQALHRPMRQLREEGLIDSSPSSHNRTVQLVSLTAEGRRLEHAINGVQRTHLRLAFDSASKAGAGWKSDAGHQRNRAVRAMNGARPCRQREEAALRVVQQCERLHVKESPATE
ncbi:MarR family winged helix-turn-helix transcriptional regulator [Noviherbaspirillum sp. L7-7A]|nr:MarR family winged helix-turn-helix transcriptional regulator [Noviherbaspirillum sp. L7-7A]